MDFFRRILNTEFYDIRAPEIEEEVLLSLSLEKYYDELDSFYEEIKKCKRMFNLRNTNLKEHLIELEEQLLKVQKKRAQKLIREPDIIYFIEYKPIIDIVYEYEELINQTRDLLKEIEIQKENDYQAKIKKDELIKKKKEKRKIIFYILPYFMLLLSVIRSDYLNNPFFYKSFGGILEFILGIILVSILGIISYAFMLFLSYIFLHLLDEGLILFIENNPYFEIKKSKESKNSFFARKEYAVIVSMLFILFMSRLENPNIILISLVIIFSSYYFLIKDEPN